MVVAFLLNIKRRKARQMLGGKKLEKTEEIADWFGRTWMRQTAFPLFSAFGSL